MDKVTDQVSNVVGISNAMLDATSVLAENLLQSEPFLRFQEAERKLNADREALQLLADFMELQPKIRLQQYSGSISESDLTRLRDLQNAIGLNTVIQEHTLARENAITFLREVNQVISNLLGLDFASLTRRSGGCC